jgi:hypothetical protein
VVIVPIIPETLRARSVLAVNPESLGVPGR